VRIPQLVEAVAVSGQQRAGELPLPLQMVVAISCEKRRRAASSKRVVLKRGP
jgi:hypothetical protein